MVIGILTESYDSYRIAPSLSYRAVLIKLSLLAGGGVSLVNTLVLLNLRGYRHKSYIAKNDILRAILLSQGIKKLQQLRRNWPKSTEFGGKTQNNGRCAF